MNTEQTNLLFPHLFDQHKIHAFLLDGQPAFLAHEVGAALGISEPRKSIRRSKLLEEGEDYALCAPKDLSQEVRSVVEREFSSPSTPPNRLIVLFESGLYTFVLRSDKPAAIEFHRWVGQGWHTPGFTNRLLRASPNHPPTLKLRELACLWG